MSQRRVVITGVGLVNALGIGKEEFFTGLLEHRSGIKRIAAFDPSRFDSRVGGESPQFAINKLVPKAHRKATKLMSRDIELAVVAADEAVKDAQLQTKGSAPEGTPNIDPVRSGAIIGAGLICCDLTELSAAFAAAAVNGAFDYHLWGDQGMATLTPLWLLKYLPNMLNCHVSIIHDLQGPSNSITCADASGQLAVGEAYRMIRNGKADLIMAGGAECKTNPMAFLRQSLLKRCSTHYNAQPEQASRPYDQDADGTVQGEGGAILILEELEHARKRGAKIYAEITGFGASTNLEPAPAQMEAEAPGVTIAVKKALTQAHLEPSALSLVVPQGQAIPDHDQAEAQGLAKALGAAASQVPVFTPKSFIGNCGAGSSAIDLATAVLCLDHDMIPSNINCPKPAVNLRLIKENTKGKLRHALTCCYTYGGQTAAVAISKM